MAKADAARPFWERQTLSEMTAGEWDCLCDGCARCCLNKLEDGDSGDIAFTEVACRLLDLETCSCRRYRQRARLIPSCVILTPEMVASTSWLPQTCAYRRVHEGRGLAWWHPLVSGDPETVFLAGVSVRGRVVGEQDAGELEDHVVDWPA